MVCVDVPVLGVDHASLQACAWATAQSVISAVRHAHASLVCTWPRQAGHVTPASQHHAMPCCHGLPFDDTQERNGKAHLQTQIAASQALALPLLPDATCTLETRPHLNDG